MRSARRFTLILVLASLLASPLGSAAAPQPPPGAYTAHAPIVIEGDADFTAANGVTSGTGTAANPYVIDGWHIVVAGGVGIRVRDVTKEFVIRDNLVECSSSSGPCIQIENTAVEGVVFNNFIINAGVGVSAFEADPRIANNSIHGYGPASGSIGVKVAASNARIVGNHMVDQATSIHAERGAPRIIDNNLVNQKDGVNLRNVAAGTLVQGNRITIATGAAVKGEVTTDVQVLENDVDLLDVGISFKDSGPLTVSGNRILKATTVGIRLENSQAALADNEVEGGQGHGLLSIRSHTDVTRGDYSNNLGIGMEFRDSTGSSTSAFLELNGGGIALTGVSVVKLRSNALMNNAYGLSIPYASRQSIPYLSGNTVNAYPVDAPGQEVYHYKDANVQVVGQVRDGGFSLGHYGALTLEGQLVLYEVDTALVQGSTLSHGVAGVRAVNSFNVQVQDSNLTSNRIGVHLQNVTAPGIIPPCVGSVKNTTIDIPIDPPGTFGIKVEGCLVLGYNNTMLNMDVGVHLDARASAELIGNVITRTTVGVHVDGQYRGGHDLFHLEANVISRNKVGVHLRGSGATLIENNVTLNAIAGVRLEAGSYPRLVRNNVSANLHGVIDMQACTTTTSSCSSLEGRGNVFVDNLGFGIWVNKTLNLKGDVVLGSGHTGIVARGHVELDTVTAIGNGEHGANVSGTFHIEGSVFTHNEVHGLRIYGNGHLDASVFAHNDNAGLRITAQLVTAVRLNVSYNHDGIILDEVLPTVDVRPPPLVIPQITLGQPTRPNGLGPTQQDPLFIHMSDIHRNFRNAIRAPYGIVNATQNWWGSSQGPIFSVPGVLEYGNTLHPGAILAYPYWKDQAKSEIGLAPFV